MINLYPGGWLLANSELRTWLAGVGKLQQLFPGKVLEEVSTDGWGNRGFLSKVENLLLWTGFPYVTKNNALLFSI